MQVMGPLSTPTPAAAAILDAVLTVVDRQGLDRATVREVAKAAGVSIGTVQHYFATKDAMLAAAFTEVVRRIHARVTARLDESHDIRTNLTAVLHEFLPLDDRRRTEVRVQVAFAARAATVPALAELQQAILTQVHQALREAIAHILSDDDHSDSPRHLAHAALALVDGLAQHAVTTSAPLTADDMTAALDTLLDCRCARHHSSRPERPSSPSQLAETQGGGLPD